MLRGPSCGQLCPELGFCLQERITFSPHPKTLTMAGDYEYFAAQVWDLPDNT